ncbi:hypothetical protein SFC34_25425 [Priestia aryabhattai]|uniref:hypothetical protein n=1 Tax=Priestia aryabhattai TaxID=412384 RepID=UPI0039824BC2
MAYFILSVLLVGCIALFILQIKKNKKLGVRYEQEKAAIKEEQKAYLETAVTNYETVIETNEIKHQEEIKKLKRINEDIRKNYRNRGEIITHNLLNDLKDDFIVTVKTS